MYLVNVILLRNGIIQENYAVRGFDEQRTNGSAEAVFLDLCRRNDPPFALYTEQEINDILDVGYHEADTLTVVISHPTLKDYQ